MTAHAKVNLHLRIMGRRSDGYHELRTVLQTVGLCDRLRAEPASPGVVELQVTPHGVVPQGDDNLVVRAAKALRRFSGVDGGAKIELAKEIPVGAGLGGGSSDAAATLVLLDTLWDLRLKPEEMMALAADLGSDVPFFLVGGLAMAIGRGEVVRPLPDLADHGVVVCTPPIEIPTGEAYRRYSEGSRLTSHRSDARVDAFVAGSETAPWEDFENDLEPVVVENWPEVGDAVAELRAAGPLHAAVSGSGASSYAVFVDLEAARAAAEALNGPWDVYAVSTVGREVGCPIVA